jgi:hypothetical protein
MYRPGEDVGRGGPWEAEEVVIAMDAATGRTVWEYTYPPEPLNFYFGAGPHASPLVVDDLLFTAGTSKQFHALDKKTLDRGGCRFSARPPGRVPLNRPGQPGPRSRRVHPSSLASSARTASRARSSVSRSSASKRS